MRYHSTKAHANNTFARQDGLWLSRTGEWYGWASSEMYACVAAPVANYGPQDHSGCAKVIPHTPIFRVRGIDTNTAEALDYAHED